MNFSDEQEPMSLKEKLKHSLSIFGFDKNSDSQWQSWYAEQKRKLNAGEEIEPPWIAFPNSTPYGWNQGYQEAWKNNVWIIFWNKMSEAEQADYLNRFVPPSEEWSETLIIYWVGDWNKLSEKKSVGGNFD